MTIRQTKAQNTVGVIALVAILLADIGLAAWYWNWKHSRPGHYSSAGFDVTPPEPVSAPPEPTPSYEPPSRPDGEDIHAQPDRASPDNEPLKTSQTPPKRSATGIRPRGDSSLSKAAAVVYALQRQPRYRKSPIIRRWTRDFLTYPDLRRINAAYWKDQDVKSFVLGTLRSPNFAKMLRNYASSPDVLSFAKELASFPEIVTAGRILSEDRTIMAAAKNVALPGLPPLGTLLSAGRGMSGQTQAQAMEKLKNDPNFRKFLESQDIPPVALQGSTPGQR